MDEKNPKPLQIKTYDIRAIEWEVANLFSRHPECCKVSVPIDLLLEKDGVRLDIQRGLERNHGVQGVTLKDSETG